MRDPGCKIRDARLAALRAADARSEMQDWAALRAADARSEMQDWQHCVLLMQDPRCKISCILYPVSCILDRREAPTSWIGAKRQHLGSAARSAAYLADGLIHNLTCAINISTFVLRWAVNQ